MSDVATYRPCEKNVRLTGTWHKGGGNLPPPFVASQEETFQPFGKAEKFTGTWRKGVYNLYIPFIDRTGGLQ